MTTLYIGLDPRFHPEQLGFLTGFIDDDDPRSAREQYDANYQSGWHPMSGWTLDVATMTLSYPGDPPLKPFCMTALHDVEAIYFYPYAQVLILQMDGSFEVSRMD
jgi:hypothetical protein